MRLFEFSSQRVGVEEIVHALPGGIELGILRLGGPGLGNLLLPWARAVIGAHNRNLEILETTWPQIKIGPWIRREPDKRSYFGIFRKRSCEISGLQKQKELWLRNWIDENDIILRRGVNGFGNLRVFSGLGKYFEPLRGHELLVRQALEETTRVEHRIDVTQHDDVGIHVRLGDFRKPSTELVQSKVPGGTRLPIDWYVSVLRDVLDVWPSPKRIKVFSDGTSTELEPLLSIPGVERMPQNAAIRDIWELSTCKVIIATPDSTFSMWAKYLGGGIAISLPVIEKQGFGIDFEVTENESKNRKLKLGKYLEERELRNESY